MRKHKTAQAFTLVELITVMVILMIMASFIMGVGRRARLLAMATKTKSIIASLEVAIGMYHTDTGEYPDDTSNATLVTDLIEDPGDVNGQQGPYMEFKREDYQDDDPATGVIVDPWGEAYRYMIMDVTPAPLITWGNVNGYNLWSTGPDGSNDSGDVVNDAVFGDDIYNW